MNLEHNSRKVIYRNPQGAAVQGTEIKLRIAVMSGGIPDRAVCVLNGTEAVMHYCFDINGSRIYECSVKMPEKQGLVFYYFYVKADGEECYYGNNALHLGGCGKKYLSVPDSQYQITVYAKGFTTPDWMKNAVVYQIFPDRFYNKNERITHGVKRSWDEEPFYRDDQFGGSYLSNDFFGGTLCGIEEKLPYLKSLGITVIYLNPIFRAFSNHRYDTSDYEHIDKNLGTDDDFKSLCKCAEESGIRIILDGVFSHTGADSKYFNKYGHFDSVGAYQSQQSPYYSWYSFKRFPDEYEAWWGFKTLPNVNELDSGYLKYIAEDADSIARQWLRRGASGWRLDVADELPDEFIETFRKAIKTEKSDALLIGEVWEDASNKISYEKRRSFLWGKSLDSVMNYVFRSAVLDYLLTANAALFSERLASMHENYPLQSLYCAMNLISSHDVPRAMTVLSGAPDFHNMDRQAQHDYFIPHDDWYLALKRMFLAVILQMTLPGAPCIYYGDEVGMCGYADPFNRKTFPWGHENTHLLEQTQRLSLIRQTHQCLRTGSYEMLYYLNGACCYMRSIENSVDLFGNRAENESMLVLINASQSEKTVFSLDLDRFGVTGLYNTETGESVSYSNGVLLEIEPLSYKLYMLERNGVECIKIQSIQ